MINRKVLIHFLFHCLRICVGTSVIVLGLFCHILSPTIVEDLELSSLLQQLTPMGSQSFYSVNITLPPNMGTPVLKNLRV